MVKVSSIHKRFGGDFLNKNNVTLNRKIEVPGFSRLGLELNGVFINKEMLCVICWGGQESKFLNMLSEEKQDQVIREIVKRNPPLFLLSERFEYSQKLLDINKEINEDRSAIIQTEQTTAEVYGLLGAWLSKALAQWTDIHGTVLNIWGEGVLLIGDPGIGKSETASDLIRKNHLFLGDDAISIARIGNIVVAKPNAGTKDFMHIRGLGILNVKQMFGGAKIITETQLSMVVKLKKFDSDHQEETEFENLGDNFKTYNLLGLSVPFYILPVTSGRSVSDLVELAVVHMKLTKQGYNAVKDMENKLFKKKG